ncbi:zinc finger, CCHC-type, retrotransposon gag domain protein [Tanacetum coccineum]
MGLMTPDLICPSTYQLLRSSFGDPGPDVSFETSVSPEPLSGSVRARLAEVSKLRFFSEEETQVLGQMISRQAGKVIKNVMPYYISQTIDNLKKVIQKELKEFKKSGIINNFRNEMATYHDFTASTRWLSAVEGAFRTSCCKEKNKVNFASNFLHDSAKMWWDGKEEFQTLMQTNETVNELWKKFNDLIRYCLAYHGNEKLKIERFQRMLRDDIREVISPFKCTTLDDLLSRARVREADLLRKKNKEAKEIKRKLEFGDQDAKKPKHDHGRRGNKSNECPNPMVIEAKPLKSIKEEKVEKTGVPNPKGHVYVMVSEEDKMVYGVVAADSKVVAMSDEYRDVDIEIDDSSFRIDLIPIMLGVFDIVIGMDWLDKYNTNILCSQKLVRVVNPQGREIIIYGDKRKGDYKLCSVMKARKYLLHGCHAFMAHVIDTSFEKKSVNDILVVNEFLDVFPKICQIPSSLTKLTKNNTPFKWGKEQEEAFVTLQKKLCEASILVLPEGTEDMVVYSDASYSGLGCILMQRGKANVVVDALSRKEREKVMRIHSLRVIVTYDLFNRIKAAQVEALKEKNWKSERITSYIPHLEDDSRGINNRQGRIYILFRSNVKELLLEEAHKSK